MHMWDMGYGSLAADEDCGCVGSALGVSFLGCLLRMSPLNVVQFACRGAYGQANRSWVAASR